MNRYNILANPRNLVGEGPIWVMSEGATYWVDITGRALFRLRWGNMGFETWPMPEMIGFVAERKSGGLVVGLRSGLFALTLEPFSLIPLVKLEPHEPANRINDATVDAAGRLWIGTMRPDGDTPQGSLYRVDHDLASTKQDEGYFIPNGPAFSCDGRIFYHADSAKRVIYRFDADDGNLHQREIFVTFSDHSWGLPDGITVDVEDHLWVAHWDGARLSRFDPDGRLENTISLPVSRVTSCTFGGPNLDRLLVTTALHERVNEPLAGALFEVPVDVKGISQPKFGG